MASITDSIVPVKYCVCGCGQVPPIATRNRVELGHIKGERVEFCPGHNRRRIPKDITSRTCRNCNEEKPIKDFYRTGKNSAPGSICKRCANKRVRDWETQNREAVRAKGRKAANERHRRLRAAVITKYGGKCAHCSENRPAALEIDHINNDGHLDRPGRRGSSMTTLRKLRDEPKRSDIQLLCGTCHNIKTRG